MTKTSENFSSVLNKTFFLQFYKGKIENKSYLSTLYFQIHLVLKYYNSQEVEIMSINR